MSLDVLRALQKSNGEVSFLSLSLSFYAHYKYFLQIEVILVHVQQETIIYS